MKCDICNEYEGTDRSVTMHKIHCAKRHTTEPEEVQPRTRETERSKRVPFGAPTQKLTVPTDDPNYVHRVFNDNWHKEPGRIQRAQKAGYEIVEERGAVGTNKDGTPIKGVHMKIPREWYEEDQKLKQAEPDRVDQAIRGGTLEEKPGDNRYIPQGIKIHSNISEKP